MTLLNDVALELDLRKELLGFFLLCPTAIVL